VAKGRIVVIDWDEGSGYAVTSYDDINEAEYVLTADEKRRAIESAEALRRRLSERMRDHDDD
jgi:hypothetical protein